MESSNWIKEVELTWNITLVLRFLPSMLMALSRRSLMSADVLLAWIKILTAMKMVSTVSITLIPGKIITRLIPVAGR